MPVFRYPDDGMGAIPDALALGIENACGEIHTATPVKRLAFDESGCSLATDSSEDRFDAIVATVPLPFLAGMTDTAPAAGPAPVPGPLDFVTRSTVLVYVEQIVGSPFPELWRYVQEPDVRIGRVANFDSWNPPGGSRSNTTPPAGHRTVLCCELWCNRGDTIWSASDAELGRLVVAELVALKVAEVGHLARTHVRRLPSTHVVPLVGVGRRAVDVCRRQLAALPGLHLAGSSSGRNDVGSALVSGVATARSVLAECRAS